MNLKIYKIIFLYFIKKWDHLFACFCKMPKFNGLILRDMFFFSFFLFKKKYNGKMNQCSLWVVAPLNKHVGRQPA